MPKATAKQFIGATRTIMVPLVFEDEEGNRLTEEFKVIYRCYTPKVAREMAAVEEEKDAGLAESLARILVSIPEITIGDDRPLDITEDNLQEMSTENLAAIYKGVTRDVSPTAAPQISTNSPSISETAPAAQS